MGWCCGVVQQVTPEEWCRYYAMLSASMNSDDEFELMMR